jgi:(p)ppGpp synthase/HD superfamily hydrolase
MQSIDQERSRRFEDMRNDGANSRERLISKIKAVFSPEDVSYLLRVLSFAESLDYQHGALTKKTYLSHPYRVAMLSMDLIKPVTVSMTALALVHNVLEVSDIPDNQLLEFLGPESLKELKALTVIRANTSAEYIAGYYHGICSCTKQARIIKALDKLDNIFMLCLNPNDEVRAMYLEEIEQYIFPIVREDIPKMMDYYKKLVLNCQNIGHVSL